MSTNDTNRAKTTEMTVEDFLSTVFEDQPEEKELHLEGGIIIDWTSREFWGG